MSTIADQAYLLGDQYRTAENLEARIDLHVRFSTNTYGWHPWVFDHLALPPHARLLELGCGPGHLWRVNGARIPSGWEITLSDLSAGMVQAARANLNAGRPFTFAVLDAQAIPYSDQSLDAVVANHMLYHVPDRARAFAEIRRVLRPGGRLVATTNGSAHLRELHALVHGVDPAIPFIDGVDFTLENGAHQLSPWFPRVTRHHYDDALVVTDAAPLIAYILSTRAGASFAGDRLTKLTDLVAGELAVRGAIHVTKSSGLFEAWADAVDPAT